VYPHVSTGLRNNTTRGFLIAVLFVSACGTQRDLPHEVRSVVGILYVTGNEPFTSLSLQTDGGRMLRIREDTTAVYRELRRLQGQKLRVQFRSSDATSDTSSISVERYDLVKVH
jgi:hypothetical protein